MQVRRIPASETLPASTDDFLFSDFGSISRQGLENNTVPMKITLTGLVLLGRREGWIPPTSVDFVPVLKRYGFFIPSDFYGTEYKALADAFRQLPLGLTRRNIQFLGPVINVVGMNVSCASCHAGHLFDSNGAPTNTAVIGIPNSSINFQGYLQAVFEGLNLYVRDTRHSYSLLRRIFPNASHTERATIRFIVTNIVKKRLEKLNASIGTALPFSSGSPGVTNGVASLKFILGITNPHETSPDYGFTSIPSLGDRFMRSSLLYDGVYFPPGKTQQQLKTSWSNEDAMELSSIAAAFTMPTMGLPAREVVRRRARLVRVTADVIANFNSPPFPGQVDREGSERGYALFMNKCASCHGDYRMDGDKPVLTSYPNRLVPQERMGTDPERWKAITPELVRRVNELPTRTFLQAGANSGYVAPLLTSLWITAPYLHNGSVPTLWHFMNPSTRPPRFQVGGHHLDYTRMGILLEDGGDVARYPARVVPASVPETYDTTQPGRSNRGHETPFANMTEREKLDLLEFLKTL